MGRDVAQYDEYGGACGRALLAQDSNNETFVGMAYLCTWGHPWNTSTAIAANDGHTCCCALRLVVFMPVDFILSLVLLLFRSWHAR